MKIIYIYMHNLYILFNFIYLSIYSHLKSNVISIKYVNG